MSNSGLIALIEIGFIRKIMFRRFAKCFNWKYMEMEFYTIVYCKHHRYKIVVTYFYDFIFFFFSYISLSTVPTHVRRKCIYSIFNSVFFQDSSNQNSDYSTFSKILLLTRKQSRYKVSLNHINKFKTFHLSMNQSLANLPTTYKAV